MADNSTKQVILNGILQQAEHCEEPYIFQNIHTLGHECRNTELHAAILKRTAATLFGVKVDADPERIRREVRLLLDHDRLTRNATIKVTVKIFPSGDRLVCYDEPSIYCGYTMRSIRPEAEYVEIIPPLPLYSTSAVEQTYALADAAARARGARTAITVDGNGEIYSSPSMPLMIVRGYSVISAIGNDQSVERHIAAQAATKIGCTVSCRPLTREDTKSADEVFFVNYQGLTSVASIGGKPYMSIISERIAQQMELSAGK